MAWKNQNLSVMYQNKQTLHHQQFCLLGRKVQLACFAYSMCIWNQKTIYSIVRVPTSSLMLWNACGMIETKENGHCQGIPYIPWALNVCSDIYPAQNLRLALVKNSICCMSIMSSCYCTVWLTIYINKAVLSGMCACMSACALVWGYDYEAFFLSFKSF